jgi:hypothetical protein
LSRFLTKPQLSKTAYRFLFVVFFCFEPGWFEFDKRLVNNDGENNGSCDLFQNDHRPKIEEVWKKIIIDRKTKKEVEKKGAENTKENKIQDIFPFFHIHNIIQTSGRVANHHADQ